MEKVRHFVNVRVGLRGCSLGNEGNHEGETRIGYRIYCRSHVSQVCVSGVGALEREEDREKMRTIT